MDADQLACRWPVGHHQPMVKPLPAPAVLLQLAREAVRNAAGLLDDADLLLTAGRWPRSLVLGVFALEEIGKCILTSGALLMPAEAADEFWKAFLDHKTKLQYAKGLLTVLETEVSSATIGGIEEAIKFAGTEHSQRMIGVYVHLRNDGTVRSPMEIEETAARRVVRAAQQLLDVLGPAWLSNEFDSRVGELLGEHREDFDKLLALGAKAVEVAPLEAIQLSRDGMLGKLPMEDQSID